ncbi:Scr1 family TA system antitoxin-like transcriptional regulator [Streptomyces sp. NPDC048304]|uniref:Scr1 family TA system antitoxin-like transcriptional regulator n=1 Tax=Streptomyces sp. NPDC048304 TaxID=3154820 RepID=UPI0033D0B070
MDLVSSPTQLEHLLEVGQLRHVALQVMPTDLADHASVSGSFRVLKLRNGKTLAYSAAERNSRVISDPREVQILDMRYGMIRALALSPRESLAFIKKLLGEGT